MAGKRRNNFRITELDQEVVIRTPNTEKFMNPRLNKPQKLDIGKAAANHTCDFLDIKKDKDPLKEFLQI